MIPMGKPLLPSAEKIKPYLDRIDSSRWYTNMGPLVQEYESRMSELFAANVCATSSCTSGLTAALLALDLPRGTLCMVQSWTFVATICAIESAGLEPYFLDIDPVTWVVDVSKLPFQPKVMVVVSPFGAPLDLDFWEKFSAETGTQIVIDAAGGFDSFSRVSKPQNIPVVISTHATKVFSSGEGGLIISRDAEFIQRVRQICNFGISPSRVIGNHGINGKMSEYHAAVGLAELDGWPSKRLQWRISNAQHNISLGTIWGTHTDEWLGSLWPLFSIKSFDELSSKLEINGVSSRQVWGVGCHKLLPYHKLHKINDLPNTHDISHFTTFIPYSIDMPLSDVDYIATSLTRSL